MAVSGQMAMQGPLCRSMPVVERELLVWHWAVQCCSDQLGQSELVQLALQLPMGPRAVLVLPLAVVVDSAIVSISSL